MRRLFVCLALALCAGPAAACVNNSESTSHEREFRSSYKGGVAPSPSPTSAPMRTPLMFLGGGVLLTGALTATLATRRRK